MLPARHASTCPECGEPIEPGDPIRRSPSYGWTHGTCPVDLPLQPRAHRRPAPPVCPSCFLQRPCGCDDT